jgi:hypothetical protein
MLGSALQLAPSTLAASQAFMQNQEDHYCTSRGTCFFVVIQPDLQHILTTCVTVQYITSMRWPLEHFNLWTYASSNLESLHVNVPQVVPYQHVSIPLWHLPQPTCDALCQTWKGQNTSPSLQAMLPPTPTTLPFTLTYHCLTNMLAVPFFVMTVYLISS